MRIPAGLLLAASILIGLALATLWLAAWGWSAEFREGLAVVQRAYGLPHPEPWWALADAHVHVLTAGLVLLWSGLLCRLFLPRALLWLPVAVVVMVAVFDEVAQLGSSMRTFSWSDQVADLCGMALAYPLLLLLRRIEVGRPPARRGTQKATPSSKTT